MPGKILQGPFVKISVEDRAQDLIERFSVEAAVQDPCVAICKRCLHEISAEDFCKDLG